MKLEELKLAAGFCGIICEVILLMCGYFLCYPLIVICPDLLIHFAMQVEALTGRLEELQRRADRLE